MYGNAKRGRKVISSFHCEEKRRKFWSLFISLCVLVIKKSKRNKKLKGRNRENEGKEGEENMKMHKRKQMFTFVFVVSATSLFVSFPLNEYLKGRIMQSACGIRKINKRTRATYSSFFLTQTLRAFPFVPMENSPVYEGGSFVMTWEVDYIVTWNKFFGLEFYRKKRGNWDSARLILRTYPPNEDVSEKMIL